MTYASAGVMKPPILSSALVLGLALLGGGCASMNPPAAASAANRQPLETQLQLPKDPPQEFAVKTGPVEDTVYLVGGLAQLGNYLVGGK